MPRSQTRTRDRIEHASLRTWCGEATHLAQSLARATGDAPCDRLLRPALLGRLAATPAHSMLTM